MFSMPRNHCPRRQILNAEMENIMIKFHAVHLWVSTLWLQIFIGPEEKDMKTHGLCLYMIYNLMRKADINNKHK